MRPLPTTYPSYFKNYIQLAEEENVLVALENNFQKASLFFNRITEEQSKYKYAHNKWSVKEILQHIIDCERIFSFRALTIARKETATLFSFDENKYAVQSQANDRTWKSIVTEFKACRQSTLQLYHSFPTEFLLRSGNVGEYTITPLALGYIIAGHAIHHMKIIQERYWDVTVP